MASKIIVDVNPRSDAVFATYGGGQRDLGSVSGSAKWRSFAGNNSAFLVRLLGLSYSVRSEARRNGKLYWYAYKRTDGKLRKFYLCPVGDSVFTPKYLVEKMALVCQRSLI